MNIIFHEYSQFYLLIKNQILTCTRLNCKFSRSIFHNLHPNYTILHSSRVLRKDPIRLEADGGGSTWASEHVYNGYIARAAVKPQCLMQPGVTTRADIMHPHRRREDACHLSARASGRAILQRIATALPSTSEKCVWSCSAKRTNWIASIRIDERWTKVFAFDLWFLAVRFHSFIFGRKRKSFKCRPVRFIQLHSCYLKLRLNLN